MTMLRVAVVAALAAGCGGDDAGGDNPDAGVGIDGQVEPSHVVFLNFEGVDLSPGNDDPVANVSFIVNAPVTMTPFLDDQADRDTRIANVVASVEATFAPYNVDVVTTRPAAAPYDMIVMTGSGSEIGLAGVGAVSPSDCADASDHIAFVFGDNFVAQGDEPPATLAVAAVGLSSGIPSSALIGDCMCFNAVGCPDANRCVVSGADTPIADNDVCAAGQTTMDVQGRFGTTFGLR